jgi:peptidoglycan/xylan/chitin deacetylase (PgdA/CDA1 family)
MAVSRALSILIYHRVLPVPDPLFPELPDRTVFTWQMAQVARFFHVLPLREAMDALRDGKLPSRAASITFDDGYADNAEEALPILLRYHLPATFFISTGFLDGGRMWNDTVIESIRTTQCDRLNLEDLGCGVHDLVTPHQRRAAIDTFLPLIKYLPPDARLRAVDEIKCRTKTVLRNDLMMSRAQVRDLHRAGMEIGGHTVSHPILSRLDLSAARAEINQGRQHLEDIIQDRVRFFAYPNGRPGEDYSASHVELVRELGFIGAVSTARGVATQTIDPFQLPRFTPWDRRASKFVLRMFMNRRMRKPATVKGHVID